MGRVCLLGVVLYSISALGGALSCEGQWELFPSAPYTSIALPDTHVAYWRFRFLQKSGSRMRLRVRGEFPHARYMNFNVYDQATINAVDALTDKDIVPAEGSSNPYNGETGADRFYEVQVVPAEEHATGPNLLRLPKQQNRDQGVELWYRLYLPKDRNVTGRVPLPKIEAVDGVTGTPIACPATYTSNPPLGNALKHLPPMPPNRLIRFFAASNENSLYSNRDTRYLAARLKFANREELAVLEWTPPGIGSDLRYWSLCLGGISTMTSACASDEEVPLRNGKVILVVGDEAHGRAVRAKGIFFIPRGTLFMPLLIYRNLLGNPLAPHSLKNVPPWPPAPGDTTPMSQFYAEQHIGAFAPKGHYVNASEFLASLPDVAQPVSEELYPGFDVGRVYSLDR